MACLRHLREIRGPYCARLSFERRTPMTMRYRLRLHAWLMSTLPGVLAPPAAIQGGIAFAAEPHLGSLTGAVASL
jgi:hypothetical protein